MGVDSNGIGDAGGAGASSGVSTPTPEPVTMTKTTPEKQEESPPPPQPPVVDMEIDEEAGETPMVISTPSTSATPSLVEGKMTEPKFLVPTTPVSSTPGSSSKKRKRLTPDERAANEKERAEKRQKMEEEKNRKDKEKKKKEQERLEKLEAAKKEKAEKDRQRELEREEKERQKEEERVKKEQDRLKREEEAAKRAEEKKKKEEERLRKEEERKRAQEEKDKEKQKHENKVKKQAAAFSNFFMKSPAPAKPKTLTVDQGRRQQAKLPGDVESDKENDENGKEKAEVVTTKVFQPSLDADKSDDEVQILGAMTQMAPKFSPMPFQIKCNMVVAPAVRRELSESERRLLDKAISQGDHGDSDDSGVKSSESGAGNEVNKLKLELSERIKRKEFRRMGRTSDEDKQEVASMEFRPEGCKRFRLKLIQFHNNRRPAYWGSWKRRSAQVNPTNPWGKDQGLEYEFDSDEEWEDEPDDAEDVENSDGEEEVEDPGEGEPQDEEQEEGWMVPHGYLSDTEREGEQMDIDTIKCQEKAFFKSLKNQVKMGIPLIQTERLSDYAMVFIPTWNRDIRRSRRIPKASTSESKPQFSGFLALQLPSDDEDDQTWDGSSDEECDTSDNNLPNPSAVGGNELNADNDSSSDDNEYDDFDEEMEWERLDLEDV